MKKKPPATAQKAYNISDEQRQLQTGQLAQGNETVMQGKQILNENNPVLQQYTQPDASGTTPFRRRLASKLASTTADTYANETSGLKNRAAASGFAGSPMEFAARTALENQRGRDIAENPLKVEQTASPLEMSAVGLNNQIQLGRGNLYNAFANSYYGGGRMLNPEQYMQQGLTEEERARQRRSGLWSGLAKAGLGVASAFL